MGNASAKKAKAADGVVDSKTAAGAPETPPRTTPRSVPKPTEEAQLKDPGWHGLGACCAACLSAAQQAQLRKLLLDSQLRQLHRARITPFNPDGTAQHTWLLRSIWRNLRPTESFVRKGNAWKAVGFQGSDPATDVRGGGLLAVQCLEHFCDVHAAGMRTMIEQLEVVNAASAERFYPISTTAIVVCCKLCDLLGLSDGVRGPISAEALETLLATSRRHLATLLVPWGRRGGFFGLFSLLMADVHTRFIRSRATYMAVQKLLTKVFEDLDRRAQGCRLFQELSDLYCADVDVAALLAHARTPRTPRSSTETPRSSTPGSSTS
jgi:hypothetical protein